MKKNIYTSCATGESFIPPKKHPEIIRIPNFNVDPDPDPDTYPDPKPCLLSLKNDDNVPSKSKKTEKVI
jgi:hypothetical protein